MRTGRRTPDVVDEEVGRLQGCEVAAALVLGPPDDVVRPLGQRADGVVAGKDRNRGGQVGPLAPGEGVAGFLVELGR